MSFFFFLSGLFVWPNLKRKGTRVFHFVYFLAGLGVGACGIERGLFAPNGALVRHWVVWLTAAVGLLLLWMGLHRADDGRRRNDFGRVASPGRPRLCATLLRQLLCGVGAGLAVCGETVAGFGGPQVVPQQPNVAKASDRLIGYLRNAVRIRQTA
jgi:hypothetical protein